LNFTEDNTIIGMTSIEGESVDLIGKIYPKEQSVEIWCKDVEVTMYDSVRNIIVKSIDDFYKKTRLNWIKKW